MRPGIGHQKTLSLLILLSLLSFDFSWNSIFGFSMSKYPRADIHIPEATAVASAPPVYEATIELAKSFEERAQILKVRDPRYKIHLSPPFDPPFPFMTPLYPLPVTLYPL